MNEATATVPRARNEIKLTTSDEARFWAKVDKNGPTQLHMQTPCWVWTAYKNKTSYGMVGLGSEKLLAHRVAWMVANGPIPHDGSGHGICVCHHCDNPSCVNPLHLFLGSHTDNMRDKDRKNRGNRASGDKNGARLHPERLARGDRHGSNTHPEKRRLGETHGNAILTDAKVINIRTKYAAGGTSYRLLAEQFGVSRQLIHFIISRKTWKHLP